MYSKAAFAIQAYRHLNYVKGDSVQLGFKVFAVMTVTLARSLTQTDQKHVEYDAITPNTAHRVQDTSVCHVFKTGSA